MKWLVLALGGLFFVVACSPKPGDIGRWTPREKIARPSKKPKVERFSYLPPVKGKAIRRGKGVYIKTGCGTFVRAVAPGRVIYVGRDISAYGWVVIVKQEDMFISVYGRLKETWVRNGEKVKSGQVLGRVDRTRNTCLLYYELRNRFGEPVKPTVRW